MKDASRAWQKHFKHSVLGFSLRAPREKALFPCHWALPHTSHPTQPQHVAHKSHSLPPFGVQGLSPCLSLMRPFVITHTEMEECSSHSSSFLWQHCPFPPSSLRISETLSDFKPAPPTRAKEVEILFQKQRFSLGKPLENSKTILELFAVVTFPHHPFISCDLLFLLTPLLLPLN